MDDSEEEMDYSDDDLSEMGDDGSDSTTCRCALAFSACMDHGRGRGTEREKLYFF